MTDKPDTRCWRYRTDEAKIFPSPEAVPANEGWVDSPAKVTAVPAAAPALPSPEPIVTPMDDAPPQDADTPAEDPPRKRGRPRKTPQ